MHSALQETPWADHARLVIMTGEGLAVSSMALGLWQPLSKMRVDSWAEFSVRLPDGQASGQGSGGPSLGRQGSQRFEHLCGPAQCHKSAQSPSTRKLCCRCRASAARCRWARVRQGPHRAPRCPALRARSSAASSTCEAGSRVEQDWQAKLNWHLLAGACVCFQQGAAAHCFTPPPLLTQVCVPE